MNEFLFNGKKYMCTCTYTDNMTTKTITISLNAYERLKAKKASNDSFTDIILKLTRKRNTLDYIRSLKPKTELTDNIEKAMLETRKAKLREIEL
jgi:predicted CopG family antitoxin